MPVLLLLVMVCVHVAAWHHAATVASSVAAQVATTDARYGATLGDGERHGIELLARLGAKAAAPLRVEWSVATVQAEVTLSVPALVPGLPVDVRRRATVARERFVSEMQR
jgi:hypothetical protein